MQKRSYQGAVCKNRRNSWTSWASLLGARALSRHYINRGSVKRPRQRSCSEQARARPASSRRSRLSVANASAWLYVHLETSPLSRTVPNDVDSAALALSAGLLRNGALRKRLSEAKGESEFAPQCHDAMARPARPGRGSRGLTQRQRCPSEPDGTYGPYVPVWVNA